MRTTRGPRLLVVLAGFALATCCSRQEQQAPGAEGAKPAAGTTDAAGLGAVDVAELLVREAEDGAREFGPIALASLDRIVPRTARVEILRARAMLAGKNQDLGRAMEALERARHLEGGDDVAVNQLMGIIAHVQGRTKDAQVLLEHATEGGPRDARALFALGDAALTTGDAADAAGYLERAVALAGDPSDPAFLLAQARRSLGDTKGALAALEQCLEAKPDHSGARLARARLATAGAVSEDQAARDRQVQALLAHDDDLSRRPKTDMRANAERIAISRQLAEAEPGLVFWRLRLANLLGDAGRTGEAAHVLGEAEPLLSSGIDVGRAARLAYQYGAYELAERLARRAMATPPGRVVVPDQAGNAPATLGACLLRQGKATEARPYLQKALELVPYRVDVRILLALTHQALGERAAAIDQYQVALKLEPDQTRALSNLGALLREDGRPQEALGLLMHARHLAPKDAAMLANLGMVLADLGQADEAVRTLGEAAALAPGDRLIAYDLGAVLLRVGRAAEAAQRLEEALLPGPRSAEVPPDAAALLDLARRQAPAP